MEYQQAADAIFSSHRLPSGRELIISAKNTHMERGGVHARIGLDVKDKTETKYLWHSVFNVDKDEERVRACNSAYTKFREDDSAQYEKRQLKHFLDNFCLGLWNTFVQYNQNIEEVDSMAENVQPQEYIIEKLIAKDEVNMMFGVGESGKSNLAIALGVTALLPWDDNPFGLKVQQASLLYLDWETTKREVNWRLKMLGKAFELPQVQFPYRRCTRPFAEEVDTIAATIQENQSTLLIIDSLAGACGGDLMKPEPALKFFEVLRQLKITTLVVAHEPKVGGSIYGTVFFHNYGRNNWEVTAEHPEEKSELTLALLHRKNNNGPRSNPMGFKFLFALGGMFIEPVDLKNTTLLEKLPLVQRIEKALSEKEMTAKELAEKFYPTTYDTISVILSRNKDKFQSTNRYWSLKDEEKT